MRNYYAIEYAYGEDVINNGQRADTLYAFRSPDDRAIWIDTGNPVRTQAGYRARLYADDPRIRRLPVPRGWMWVSWRATAQPRYAACAIAHRLIWSGGRWEEDRCASH